MCVREVIGHSLWFPGSAGFTGCLPSLCCVAGSEQPEGDGCAGACERSPEAHESCSGRVSLRVPGVHSQMRRTRILVGCFPMYMLLVCKRFVICVHGLYVRVHAYTLSQYVWAVTA